MVSLQFDPATFNFIFIAGVMLVMYMFFIRPQVKKQKAQDEFVKNLSKGDEVVTTSGLIGRVNKIDSHSINLELGQKMFVQMVPGAISMEMTENYKKRNSA